MNSKTRKAILPIVKEIFVWILALSVLVPLYLMFINALKDNYESSQVTFSLPSTWHWENFVTVWNVGKIYDDDVGAVLIGYFNSIILTLSTVAFTLIVAAPSAFVLARRKSKLNKLIYIYFAMGLIVPTNMIAVVKVIKVLGLYNNRFGTICILTSFVLPFSIFLYYGFISSVPKELDEAGFIDGANAYSMFFRIIFPLLKPVTVTVVMINFLNVWNDYGVALYTLFHPAKQVILQVMLRFVGTGQYSSKWNNIFVAVIYGILPILVTYVIGQKYIISGMTAGAVKG